MITGRSVFGLGELGVHLLPHDLLHETGGLMPGASPVRPGARSRLALGRVLASLFFGVRDLVVTAILHTLEQSVDSSKNFA
jgi:hypothetical protein